MKKTSQPFRCLYQWLIDTICNPLEKQIKLPSGNSINGFYIKMAIGPQKENAQLWNIHIHVTIEKLTHVYGKLVYHPFLIHY